jgi:hypothetical protein
VSWVLFFQITFLMCLAILGVWISVSILANAAKERELIAKGYISKEVRTKL